MLLSSRKSRTAFTPSPLFWLRRTVHSILPYRDLRHRARHGLVILYSYLPERRIDTSPHAAELGSGKFFQPLHVLAACTAGATLLAFCWITVTESTAGLIVWCLLYGFCSGAFVSLQGAAVASMTTDFATIGTRFDINMFCGAIGI